MTFSLADAWPNYTYVEPHVYTKACIRLIGLGMYVPKGIITNEFFSFLATRLGDPRSVEAFENATGLTMRRVRSSTLDFCRSIVGPEAPGLIYDETTSDNVSVVDMAVIAAQRALMSAGREASEIDAVIAASSSDDNLFPTLAGLVQMHLGCRQVRALTLKGACACQVEAFQVAAEMLSASTSRLVLVVAADAMLSQALHILNWKTSSLFGEGATAFLIERGERDSDETYVINGYDARQGPALCLQVPLRKDAMEMAEIDDYIARLYQKGRGLEVEQYFSKCLVGYMHMNGARVYLEAPRAMAECVDALCRQAQLSSNELAHIVPHQANSRITRRIGELLIRDYGWPDTIMAQLADHVRTYGNLANASIGMALIETLRSGSLLPGQWIALPAVGGGMHYGCWLLRYQGIKNIEHTMKT